MPMSDDRKIRILSYDKVWSVEKKIHAIYNFKLPVPVAIDQFQYVAGIVIIMFLPIFHFLPTIIRFVMIPYFGSNYLSKIKLDGKNPIRFFLGYIGYLVSERSTYIEKFRVFPIRKEEKISLEWVCSRGYFPDIEEREVVQVSNEKKRNMKVLKKVQKPDLTVPDKVIKEKKKEIIVPSKIKEKGTKPEKKLNKKEQKEEQKKEIGNVQQVLGKTISIYCLPGAENIQMHLSKELIEFFERSKLKYSLTAGVEKEVDYTILLKQVSEETTEEAIKILVCCLDNNYLKSLDKFVSNQKKVKEWKFIFLNLNKAEKKSAGDLMEDYKYYILSDDQAEEKEKVISKILKQGR